MPITPLPADGTDRFYLDYTVQGEAHTMIARADGGYLASDAADGFAQLLTALTPLIVVTTIVGMRHSVAGSDVTVPVGTGDLEATYGTESAVVVNKPLQATFTGRSLDGHKTRFGFYGLAQQTDQSWRYTVAENTHVADALDVLGAFSAAGLFISISGGRVSWNKYMNVGYNDHFVQKERRGG